VGDTLISKETEPVGHEPGEPLLAPEPLAPPDTEPEVVAPLEAEPDAALPLLPEPDEADEPEEPPPSVPITKKLDEHPVTTVSASETANTKDKSRMAQYPLIRGVPPHWGRGFTRRCHIAKSKTRIRSNVERTRAAAGLCSG
jgi:hypothetical protein